MKILVTPTSFKPDGGGEAASLLRSFAAGRGFELVYNLRGKPLGEDELLDTIGGCAGYIAGLDTITKKVIEAAKDLKVISRYGVGVDRVDLAAAKAAGVTVCNTPGANAEAVAELAFTLLLCCARKVHFLDRKTRSGEWPRSNGVELAGKTIGILGLGAVGKNLARQALGFSMKVLAYDPYIDEVYAKEHGIGVCGFDELVKRADCVSLHLPLTEETRHIISAEVMGEMKPGAIIINTARGGLIDEDAAHDFLRSGHLGGLGLDVYEEEPPQASPLFGMDNVVLTPHTASHTVEATNNMAMMSVRNLIDVLSGNGCPYAVNR